MAFSEDPEMLALAGKMEMRPDDETAIEMCQNVLTLPILDKLTEYSELQAEGVRYVADYLVKLDSGELNSIFKGRLLLDSGAFGLQGSDIKKPFLLLFSEPNYNMNAIIGANNSMDTYYFSVDRAAHLDYCDIVFTSVNEELRANGMPWRCEILLQTIRRTFLIITSCRRLQVWKVWHTMAWT